MRLLGTVLGGVGHVAAMRPLLAAAAEAGHEVLLVLGDGMDPGGLPSVHGPPMGDDDNEAFGRIHREGVALGGPGSDEANDHFVEHGFGTLVTRHMLPVVARSIAEFRPDVVVSDPLHGAGVVACLDAGVPMVSSSYLLRRPAVPLVAAAMRGASTGIDGRIDAAELTAAVLGAPWATPYPTMLEDEAPPPYRQDLGDPGAAAAVRWRIAEREPASRLDGDVAAWVDADGRPVVYATMGSVVGQMPPLAEGFAACLYEAVADLDVRCLLTTGRDAVDGLDAGAPSNVRVEPFVRHRPLMARVGVVVSHGGMNTALDAAVASVPQVVLPMQSADQRWNGLALASQGAGEVLLRGEQDPDALRTAILAGLEPTPARSAAVGALADAALDLPAPRDVVDDLAALVAA